MDFLMAENSAVDNNDMHRRSSQVSQKSSKTNRTRNMDALDDKVINKASDELKMSKQGTQTTKLLSGIEDKVIHVNSSQYQIQPSMISSAIDDYGENQLLPNI